MHMQKVNLSVVKYTGGLTNLNIDVVVKSVILL